MQQDVLQVLNRDTLREFLARAAKHYPGDDWADRYADAAHEEFGVEPSDFKERLERAKAAYEKELDGPDCNWPRWYADHILNT